jgi:hypothetical protein
MALDARRSYSDVRTTSLSSSSPRQCPQRGRPSTSSGGLALSRTSDFAMPFHTSSGLPGTILPPPPPSLHRFIRVFVGLLLLVLL